MIEVKISTAYNPRDFEQPLKELPGVEIEVFEENGFYCAMTDSLEWVHRFLDQVAASPAPARRAVWVTFVGRNSER